MFEEVVGCCDAAVRAAEDEDGFGLRHGGGRFVFVLGYTE